MLSVCMCVNVQDFEDSNTVYFLSSSEYASQVHTASVKLRTFSHWHRCCKLRRALAQHQDHMTQLANRFQARRFFCRWQNCILLCELYLSAVWQCYIKKNVRGDSSVCGGTGLKPVVAIGMGSTPTLTRNLFSSESSRNFHECN